MLTESMVATRNIFMPKLRTRVFPPYGRNEKAFIEVTTMRNGVTQQSSPLVSLMVKTLPTNTPSMLVNIRKTF